MKEFEVWKFPKRKPVGFNYYRDLFLSMAFILFSIGALVLGLEPSSPEDQKDFYSFVLCGCACILLAKEKVVPVLGALAFISFRLFLALPRAPNWQPVWVLLVCIAIGVLLFWWIARKNYEPSYSIPEGLSLLDGFVAALGMGTALLIGYWIRH